MITFNANGGTGTMPAQHAEYMKSIKLDANRFTRSGYTFAYWSTTPSGTGTTYANEATVVLSDDITLYAIWSQTPVSVYTVTFDSNGGSDV